MTTQSIVKQLRFLLRDGGRLIVTLPDVERRLRDRLEVDVDVTIGVEPSVIVQRPDGREFLLLEQDREAIYRLMLQVEEA